MNSVTHMLSNTDKIIKKSFIHTEMKTIRMSGYLIKVSVHSGKDNGVELPSPGHH